MSEAVCTRCRGRGELRPIGLSVEPVPCPVCEGSGRKTSRRPAISPTARATDALIAAPPKRRPQPIGHASPEQRAKVKREAKCRHCGADKHVAPLDPAHVVGRDMGGCDSEHCVICLCRVCHRRQEVGELDVLPYLSELEQAHGVSHVGAVSFLHLATGERWWPESARRAA